MTIDDIRRHLQTRNMALDEDMKRTILRLKAKAITEGNESEANALWCYDAIFDIKKRYYDAYIHMERAVQLSNNLFRNDLDSPKSALYEVAWNELIFCDMRISAIEKNFCIFNSTLDCFHIYEIKTDIQKLLSLFPYRLFLSLETIIKKEKCSICGKTTNIRNRCGHKVGKVYMGEVCCKIVVDMELLSINLVTKPFDRCAILKIPGDRLDFNLLDNVIPRIKPYMEWSS